MWKQTASELSSQGKKPAEIRDIVNQEFGLILNYDDVRNYLRVNMQPTAKLGINNDSLLEALKKECSVDDLCDRFNVAKRVLMAYVDDLKDNGYQITESNDKLKINKTVFINDNVHVNDWDGEEEQTFAIVSDTHGGAKSEQATHLNDFYDRCVQAKVKDVFHTGDMVDGDNVYPGHQYHVHTFGADAQKDYIVKNYPKREGITTHFITGNHCLKNFTKTGYDIGHSIAAERKDMKYLGQYYARVYLTPKCILQLEHPLGMPSYAASYKIQRKIDNMSGGDKPAILAQGHFHYSCYVFRRNVHGLMMPSFQGPNDLSRRLGLECDMGGVIITIKVDKEGTIREFTPKFIPYLVPIVDDYKKYI